MPLWFWEQDSLGPPSESSNTTVSQSVFTNRSSYKYACIYWSICVFVPLFKCFLPLSSFIASFSRTLCSLSYVAPCWLFTWVYYIYFSWWRVLMPINVLLLLIFIWLMWWRIPKCPVFWKVFEHLRFLLFGFSSVWTGVNHFLCCWGLTWWIVRVAGLEKKLL